MSESYKWFAIAAAQGDKDAAGRRDEVAATLTPDQLAKARAAVSAWKAKPSIAEANVVSAPAGGWDGDGEGVTASDQQALVKKIQALLTEQGYDVGTPDGVARKEGLSRRELVDIVHPHLFTVPIVLFILGHLLHLTRLPDRLKLAVNAGAFLAFFVTFVSPLVVADRAAIGWLLFGGGCLFLLSLAALCLVPVWEMWLGEPGEGFDVVSLRSWEPNYNIDVIVEAFARFAKRRPASGAVLHLLGGGAMGDMGKPLAASRLAILPATSHTAVINQTDLLYAFIEPFLKGETPKGMFP